MRPIEIFSERKFTFLHITATILHVFKINYLSLKMFNTRKILNRQTLCLFSDFVSQFLLAVEPAAMHYLLTLAIKPGNKSESDL